MVWIGCVIDSRLPTCAIMASAHLGLSNLDRYSNRRVSSRSRGFTSLSKDCGVREGVEGGVRGVEGGGRVV